jgi:hypothetical protein
MFFASNLCLKEICIGLYENEKYIEASRGTSEPECQAVPKLTGTLFQESGEKALTLRSSKRLTEEEQWEQEIQRELDAKKKKKETAGSINEELSPEEKKLL